MKGKVTTIILRETPNICKKLKCISHFPLNYTMRYYFLDTILAQQNRFDCVVLKQIFSRQRQPIRENYLVSSTVTILGENCFSSRIKDLNYNISFYEVTGTSSIAHDSRGVVSLLEYMERNNQILRKRVKFCLKSNKFNVTIYCIKTQKCGKKKKERNTNLKRLSSFSAESLSVADPGFL